jgi:MoaA/NifB/PqqE/SkfB family radical SAM enzyme
MNDFTLKLMERILLYKLNIIKPTFAQFVITTRCNLDCKFCFIPKEDRKRCKELSTWEVFNLIESLHNLGIIDLLITGGEPLLRSDIIEIASYAKNKGFRLNLISNGTLITRKNAKELCNYFDTISISLDGFEKTHNKLRGNKNAFQLAMRAIKTLFKNRGKCLIGVATTLMKENKDEIIPLFRKLRKTVNFVGIQPIHFDKKRTPLPSDVLNLIDALLRMKKESPSYLKNTSAFIKLIPRFFGGEIIKICDAGRLYFTISPQGHIFPCLGYGMPNSHRLSSTKNIPNKKIDIRCDGCLVRCTTDISLLFRNFLQESLSCL